MELRRLRLLHELARRGTIAAAADALSYSPSSVSVQLAELEREAGVKLLRRVGRNVELTPAGSRLAEHAAQALAADEDIRAQLASLSDAPRGELRMTFVQTPALALLPATLAALSEAAPDLEVHIIQRETAPAIDELRSRAVDLVVGVEYEPLPVARHRDVDRLDLVDEDVLLAVPAEPGTTRRDPLSLARFEHAAWAAGHPETGHSRLIGHVCNRLGGYAPDIRHRTDDAIILSALVASGRAVTLLPALAAGAAPGVSLRPIRGMSIRRTIFSACRSSATQAPAVTAARSALAEAAKTAATGRRDVALTP